MSKLHKANIAEELDIKVVSNDSCVFIILYGDWSYLWVMDFSIFNPGGWSAASDRAIASATNYSFVQNWDPGELGIPIWGY